MTGEERRKEGEGEEERGREAVPPDARKQRPGTRPLTHCNGHLEVKMCVPEGKTVAHIVTYYSFHDVMFSICFVCLWGWGVCVCVRV